MKVVGIVVEYNPLHNGHQYHFEEAKRVTNADAVVAVMSGNFLQRGEPAIVNKWARTQMALEMGVDLVLELPVTYSSQNAELFAHGAISILDATGVVDALCFGSESGDVEWMKSLSATLAEEPASFKKHLRASLQKGISYPRAYGQAVQQWIQGEAKHSSSAQPEPVPVHQPNNILGINYLIALHRLRSLIQPYTIIRQKAGYHQQNITDTRIASATAIRQLLFEEKNLPGIAAYVPSFTLKLLQNEWDTGRGPISFESFCLPLFHTILTQSVSGLRKFYECTEGLEYRLYKEIRQSKSVNQLIEQVKSKRYTWNRIQRLMLNVLLNRTQEDIQALRIWDGPRYIRVLGFNSTGQKLLHSMKKKAKTPVITKVMREPDPMLAWDIRASEIYSLAYDESTPLEVRKREYRQAPIRI